MNKLILIGSLAFGLNAATQPLESPLQYVDVFASTTICNQTTKACEQIVYIDQEEEVVLGFDVNKYLPEGFDPYEVKTSATPEDIEYIEEDEKIHLGFDVNKYLPEGFDPYEQKTSANLKDIEYIEEEEIVHLDFDVNKYLPKDFNPYKKKQ